MKITKNKLEQLIETNLLIETNVGEFVKAGLEQALKSNKISKETIDNIIGGIAAIDSLGEHALYKAIGSNSKGKRLVIKLGVAATPAAATALGIFGAFTFIGGVFYALPKMISATIDSLNTIPGSILNFYKTKNGSQILHDEEQKPITWSEFGNASGVAAKVASNFGINRMSKNQLATILAASRLMKDTPDIMKKIEKMGQEKFGTRSWYESGEKNKEGYTRIFDASFYKAIGKRTRELKKAGSLKAQIYKKVKRAIKTEDLSTLKTFGELAVAVLI